MSHGKEFHKGVTLAVMTSFPVTRFEIICTIMDVLGRRRKVYRPRINPLEYFDDEDFLARYRLNKEIVRELSGRFANSQFISTYGDGRGSVISPEERVCIYVRLSSIWDNTCIVFVFMYTNYRYSYNQFSFVDVCGLKIFSHRCELQMYLRLSRHEQIYFVSMC